MNEKPTRPSRRLRSTLDRVLVHDIKNMGFRLQMLLSNVDEHYGDPEFKRSVQDDTGIKPEWAAEAFSDLDEDVRQSIARIKASPFIPRKDAVRGFVYEVETGKLREVDAGPVQSRFKRESATEGVTA